MRGSLILSALFHIAVIVIALVGLPSVTDREIVTQQVIDVAVVTDIETKAPPLPPKPEPKPKPAPKKPPEPPKPPKPEPQAALPKPPPPPPPPPDAVKLPEPEKKPEPEPKPEPVAKPEPKPEPEPEPKPEPVPKPAAKPEPKPEPKVAAKPEVKLPPRPKRKPKPPPPKDDFASVLKTVEKLKSRPKPKQPEKSFDQKIEDILKKHQNGSPQTKPQQVSRLDQNLSMSEIDVLRRQIERCWNPPAGAPEAENLIVEVRLAINRDGTVRSAQIVDTARMFREPFYRAAAESVIRAIKHPRCTPLKLPQEKYDLWKETRLRFDPRELVGR